jgi:hypothetical protein
MYDEYSFYNPLHRSYEDMMFVARVAIALNKQRRQAHNSIHSSSSPSFSSQPYKLKLSPWNDPSVAKSFKVIFQGLLERVLPNSILIYMGTTDASTIVSNLYEREGDSQVEGIEQLAARKEIMMAKLRDIKPLIHLLFDGKKVTPERGGLSKLHKVMFIDTTSDKVSDAVKSKDFNQASSLNAANPYTMHNPSISPDLRFDPRPPIRIAFGTNNAPAWHTAHTDTLVLMNIVCAWLIAADAYRETIATQGEVENPQEFAASVYRKLVYRTGAFSKQQLKLSEEAAAMLYMYLLTGNVYHKYSTAPLNRSSAATATALAIPFYKIKRRKKASPSVDISRKGKRAVRTDEATELALYTMTEEEARQLASDDPELRKEYYKRGQRMRRGDGYYLRGHVQQRSAEEAFEEDEVGEQNTSSSSSSIPASAASASAAAPTMKDLLRAVLPPAEFRSLGWAHNDLQSVDLYAEAMRIARSVRTDMASVSEWPMFYISRHTAGSNTIVLHNRYCHILYKINYDKLVDRYWFARERRDTQTLIPYSPLDQIWFQNRPVFCKQCTRYVHDYDPAKPRLIEVADRNDPWANKEGPPWQPEAFVIGDNLRLPPWRLSYRSDVYRTEVNEVLNSMETERSVIRAEAALDDGDITRDQDEFVLEDGETEVGFSSSLLHSMPSRYVDSDEDNNDDDDTDSVQYDPDSPRANAEAGSPDPLPDLISGGAAFASSSSSSVVTGIEEPRTRRATGRIVTNPSLFDLIFS